jgi:hypothetical protein
MIYTMLQTILNTLIDFISDVNSQFNNFALILINQQQQLTNIQNVQTEQTKLLEQILQQLQPPLATALVITFTSDDQNKEKEENNMDKNKATKAGVDFQLLDNGTATATVSFVDSVGNPTVAPNGAAPATFTSSDPSITVSATGPLTATLTPTALATGVIITASVVVTDPTGVNPPVTLTGSGNPIDVVAGAASALSIAEQ